MLRNSQLICNTCRNSIWILIAFTDDCIIKFMLALFIFTLTFFSKDFSINNFCHCPCKESHTKQHRRSVNSQSFQKAWGWRSNNTHLKDSSKICLEQERLTFSYG